MGLQQERAIRTRRLMLKSAAEVFDREDYASARLSDISALANMSTGALHFHFENKDDLAEAVVREARDILWRAARLAYEKNSEPLQALTDISHALSQLLSRDVVTRAGLRLDSDRSRRGREQFIHAWRVCVQRLLHRARQEGGLAAQVQLQDLTCALVAATAGIGMLIKGGEGERTRLAFTGFWQSFLPGLAAPSVLGGLRPGGTRDVVDHAVATSRCPPYDCMEAVDTEVIIPEAVAPGVT
ncbi:ScbR family autoregulator-binding transcription factor [Streptomyces sp. NBC_00459]|uniref:ScbR family autoregulator-binding transcription factor n=1 Tax=Streptomyces sp. NBC_00459 TaxID=2975749 RepID=UPI002E16EE4C